MDLGDRRIARLLSSQVMPHNLFTEATSKNGLLSSGRPPLMQICTQGVAAESTLSSVLQWATPGYARSRRHGRLEMCV